MPIPKAELAARAAAYRSKLEAARAAEAQGLYRDVLRHAIAASEDVDGMLQFAKKYENRKPEKIEAIDLVLKYAALLLDLKTLGACEEFLRRSRLLERPGMAEAMKAAIDAMWQNHRLWNLMERSSDVRQDQLPYKLGGEAAGWREVVESWEKTGLISRERIGRTFLLTLSTRLGQVVSAKCSHCGKISEAPKAMFLEPLDCPACGAQSDFVLVEPEASTAG